MGKREDWLFGFAAIGAVAALVKILEYLGVHPPPIMGGGGAPVPIAAPPASSLAWGIGLFVFSFGLSLVGLYLSVRRRRLLTAQLAEKIEACKRRDDIIDELRSAQSKLPSPKSVVGHQLVFAGYTGWKRPWDFGAPQGTLELTVVYIRNNQLASAKDIHNVRARIDYLYDGELRFSADKALWWEEHDDGQPIETPTAVDLEPNQQQCFPVFMEGKSLECPHSALDEGNLSRPLKLGRWTARITVTADACGPLKGELQFTVYRPPGGRGLAIGCQPPLGLTRLPIERRLVRLMISTMDHT